MENIKRKTIATYAMMCVLSGSSALAAEVLERADPQQAPGAAAPTTATGNKSDPCAAAQGIDLKGVTVTDICATVLADFKDRPTLRNPPMRYLATAQNEAFASNLSQSVRRVNRPGRKVIVDLGAGITVDDLRTAKAPEYKESELGIWLDRIDEQGNQVVVVPDTQAVALAPIVFEWIGKPLLRYFINVVFKKDPYGSARQLDAVIRTHGSGADAGTIRRICFVPRGQGRIRDICAVT